MVPLEMSCTRNVYAKYDSHISNGKKVMAKFQVFFTYKQRGGQIIYYYYTITP